MSIRIIVASKDYAAARGPGIDIPVEYKTFLVEHEELERYLCADMSLVRAIVGGEIIHTTAEKGEGE